MLSASNDVFNSISALRPKRHGFNLSYRKKFDADFGFLYPICCEEVVPGDRFSVGNEIKMLDVTFKKKNVINGF